jgi:hypothetical protein
VLASGGERPLGAAAGGGLISAVRRRRAAGRFRRRGRPEPGQG